MSLRSALGISILTIDVFGSTWGLGDVDVPTWFVEKSRLSGARANVQNAVDAAPAALRFVDSEAWRDCESPSQAHESPHRDLEQRHHLRLSIFNLAHLTTRQHKSWIQSTSWSLLLQACRCLARSHSPCPPTHLSHPSHRSCQPIYHLMPMTFSSQPQLVASTPRRLRHSRPFSPTATMHPSSHST